MTSGALRVLIVDDNRTSRALIRAALSDHPMLEVVGEAADAVEARDLVKTLRPDVMTLDVEMPGMNGLQFLELVMARRPMPVVMISSHTGAGSEAAIKALSLGAVECLDRQGLGSSAVVSRRLAEAVVTAGRATVVRHVASTPDTAPAASQPTQRFDWGGQILLIGSSTGGVEALETVLRDFPVDCPPTLIAQHMPANFLASFASRLNTLIRPEVVLARAGAPLKQGVIHLCPGGDQHIGLRGRGPQPTVKLIPADGTEQYVPTVNILYDSAVHLGDRVVGCILTGMGRDGADGLLNLRQAGATTFAQSAASCVINGMPGAARENGAVMHDVALAKMGARLLDACSSSQKAMS